MDNFQLLIDAAALKGSVDSHPASHININRYAQDTASMSTDSDAGSKRQHSYKSWSDFSSEKKSKYSFDRRYEGSDRRLDIAEGRYSRRECFTNIARVFNKNDVKEFREVLRECTTDSVIVTAKTIAHEMCGFLTLSTLWSMILEGYPDGVIDALHPRELGENSIEFQFKFSGHRITAQPVINLFSSISQKLALGAKVSSEDTLKIVTRSSVDSTLLTSSTAPCPFVSTRGKIILTYDASGKISHWFLDVPI